ncbi:hypothetical protein GGI15_004751 [Coemansia interrupta]|uniref:Uncharacterized protein n=1 Tax=Coemansia interrupta TaxID=1126814 RepID=A0A9W8H2A1_9FUNG|nr:hypothetical protein GGI15_004751 [Coemansia interrupta]
MSKTSDLLSAPNTSHQTLSKGDLAEPLKEESEQQQQHYQRPMSSESTVQPLSGNTENMSDTAQVPVQAYAKLEGPDFCYYIRTLEVSLGRHPSNEGTDGVDIDLGDSKAVSRKHAKIFYNFMNQSFELQVFGKNGCLVDDDYVAKGQSVMLRHKMVIQIGDTEFTFLLPKSAMSSSGNSNSGAQYQQSASGGMAGGGVASDGLQGGHLASGPDRHHPMDAAISGAHPGARGAMMAGQPLDLPPQHHPHPHHHHQHPHGGYPVNAITPQRLNLYSAPDALSRNMPPHRQPGGPPPQPLQYHDRHHYSPSSSPHMISRDHPPPPPLQFKHKSGADYAARPPPPRDMPPMGGPLETGQHDQRMPPMQPHAPPPAHDQRYPPPAPGNPEHASSTSPGMAHAGMGAAATSRASPPGVRILPSTERPAQEDGPVDRRNLVKPVLSYASLIAQAINATAEKKVTLSGIYSFIMQHYSYYRYAQNGWQNSIRHNLSLNKAFVRVQRANNEPGKGSYWAIEDSYKAQFANGVYKRTRRTKKAMERERELERQKMQEQSSNDRRADAPSGASLGPAIAPRRAPAGRARGSSVSTSRRAASQSLSPSTAGSGSMAGGKRMSPDGENDSEAEDYDVDDDGDAIIDNDDNEDIDDEGASGQDTRRRSSTRRPPAKRTALSDHAHTHLSTGEDTVDYMSSAASNNGESNPGSAPESPTGQRQRQRQRQPPPSIEKDEIREGPPAIATRSRTGSINKQQSGNTSYASANLPSSSRPSQPRPQKSTAH